MSPLAPQASRSGLRQRLIFAAGLTIVAGMLVLPWWRNHTMLRDFYDYGLVMAAAGRMTLGERPYVDFLTPIQTLHFLLAQFAETIFGARYLSLTYANAVFIVGAFGGLVALFVRPLGRVVAVIMAAAIIAATAGQHTIVWHNVMGVIWVTGVIGLMAGPRIAGERGAWWRLGLVWLLLWLLGMTKLTFLATGLAFAALFTVRDGWLGLRSWRAVGLTLISYAGFGLIAPVATEMLYTGATLGQWLHNVVLMPQSRVELLWAMASPDFYLHTPHNYYLPMYVPFIGAWGLGVLLVFGTIAYWQTLGKENGIRSVVFIAVMTVGAWICGGILLATNFDMAYVTGAVWLAFGLGIALAMPPGGDGRVIKSARIALGIAGVSLLLPAWQAAWEGTRALWGTAPLVRSELVTTDNLPARYAYFYGMKIPESLRMSMEVFAGRQAQLAREGMPPSAFYFGNAVEWLVRAVPEARHRGLPLWLMDGTTFREPEARILNHLLGTGNAVQAVVSLEGWNIWHYQTDWFLKTRYTHELFGPLFNVYLRSGSTKDPDWQDLLTFATATGSTADPKDLIVTGGQPALCLRPDGDFVGAPRSLNIGVKIPLNRIRGEWVVRRIAPARDRASVVAWRVVAIGMQGTPEILGKGLITLTPEQQEQTADFDLAPSGKQVSLEIDVPPGGYLEAGFRALHTEYSEETSASLGPCPIDESLSRQTDTASWADVLFASGAWRPTEIEGAALAIGADELPSGPGLMVHTPGQIWFKIDSRLKRLSGEFGLKDVAWSNADALAGVAAKVVFIRPGRLEVLMAKEIRPRDVEADRSPQLFDLALPGEAGWIGLTFTSLNPPHNAYGQSWWGQIKAW